MPNKLINKLSDQLEASFTKNSRLGISGSQFFHIATPKIDWRGPLNDWKKVEIKTFHFRVP